MLPSSAQAEATASHQAVHHATQQAEALPSHQAAQRSCPRIKPCTNDAQQAEVLPSHQAVHHATQQAEVLPSHQAAHHDAQQAEVLPSHQAVHHATQQAEALTSQLITHVHQDLQPGIAEASGHGGNICGLRAWHRLHLQVEGPGRVPRVRAGTW
jgi:hypothetical protein